MRTPALPIRKLNGKKYYVDIKRLQVRSVKNPNDFINFKNTEDLVEYVVLAQIKLWKKILLFPSWLAYQSMRPFLKADHLLKNSINLSEWSLCARPIAWMLSGFIWGNLIVYLLRLILIG